MLDTVKGWWLGMNLIILGGMLGAFLGFYTPSVIAAGAMISTCCGLFLFGGISYDEKTVGPILGMLCAIGCAIFFYLYIWDVPPLTPREWWKAIMWMLPIGAGCAWLLVMGSGG